MVGRNNQQRNNVGDPFFREVDPDLNRQEEEMAERSTENPGLIISNIVLEGSNNFLAWKNSIARALTAKDRLSYIKEEEEVPFEGPQNTRNG